MIVSYIDQMNFGYIITMKEIKPDIKKSNRDKILEGMDKVYENLIAFKKKMNSELVILKEGKILRIKP